MTARADTLSGPHVCTYRGRRALLRQQLAPESGDVLPRLVATLVVECNSSCARASAAWRLCVPVPAWIAATSPSGSCMASAAVASTALRLPATAMFGRRPPAARPRMKRHATALLISGCVVAVAASIQSVKPSRESSSAYCLVSGEQSVRQTMSHAVRDFGQSARRPAIAVAIRRRSASD